MRKQAALQIVPLPFKQFEAFLQLVGLKFNAKNPIS
jgi:hypothetical protein